MYHTTDHVYQQTLAIKIGQERLPLENELVVEIANHFGVVVVNFHCYRVETTANFKQQHVVLVVDSMQDKTRLEDTLDDAWLSAIFTRYFDHPERDSSTITKRDVFTKTVSGYPPMVFGCSAFEEIEMRKAYTSCSRQITALTDQYQEIWHIAANDLWHTVFYFTPSQMAACVADGRHETIQQNILRILKSSDQFGYIGPHWLQFIQFDTKDRFDTQFEGNWYYYYK